MKKIKLITPILTLATISSSLMPLASCNKNKSFDGQVTEAEWKEAIDYLGWQGKEMPYWSFGEDDYALLYMPDSETEQYTLFTYKGWTATPDGVYANCVHRSKDGSEEKFDFYEKVYGDAVYTCMYEYEIQDYSYRINTFYDPGSPTVLIWIALSSVYDYHDDFTFNSNDKHYHYTGALEEFFSVDTQIAFNDDKRVDHVSCTLTYKDGRVAKTDFHLNYNKKEITWPDGFDDRAKRHLFELKPEGTTIDTTCFDSEEEGVVLVTTPTVDNLKYLRAYKDGTKIDMFDSPNIVIDGEMTEEFTTTDNQITFNDTLPKSKQITINFHPAKADGEYTFKLEAA